MNVTPIQSFYSIKEFAIVLAVHPNTIRKAIKNGRIFGFRVDSGSKASYRIPHTEINRLATKEYHDILYKISLEKVKNEPKP